MTMSHVELKWGLPQSAFLSLLFWAFNLPVLLRKPDQSFLQ